jgi:23S rRNA (guanosine2251-2'-O)-methyltransferase
VKADGHIDEQKETLFGINVVWSRLKARDGGIDQLLIRKGRLSARLGQILQRAEDRRIPVERLSVEDWQKLTSVNHQGVGLVVQVRAPMGELDLSQIVAQKSSPLLLLALDGVTDPRNLGACLRSAATLGVDAVIVPRDKSAGLTESAIKTASGADQVTPLITVTNLARCLDRLKQQGVWVVGTLLDAEQSITDVDLTADVVLVLGSEGKGLRPKTVKYCDLLARIPMRQEEFGFNVSVATGICLYEAVRQRTLASQ